MISALAGLANMMARLSAIVFRNGRSADATFALELDPPRGSAAIHERGKERRALVGSENGAQEMRWRF